MSGARRYRGDVDRLKVCVVGAGMSGLITVKELLDENHQVVCFERQGQEGGVFNLSERKGNTAYDSTLLTISNYAMAFSCFPPKDHEERRFWTVREYQRYLDNFASFYNLRDYIRFSSEVTALERWKGSKWLVYSRRGEKTHAEVFDAVAICAGAFQQPRLPVLPFAEGKERTPIQVLHSVDYRNAEPFFGKRVLCIGLGESGADIVHEISCTADASMLSVRPTPPPLIPRYDCEHLGPIPNDGETTQHRYGAFLNQYRSVFNQTKRSQTWERAVLDEPEAFAMDIPEHASKYQRIEAFIARWNRRSYAGGLPFLSRFLTKNTLFVEDVVEGRLGINFSEIRSIQGHEVVFNDGQTFHADVIVCCTGYQDESPPLFQKDPLLRECFSGPLNPRKWFKHTFHPKLGKRLAFIGYARPAQGLLPACAELQARYFALLASNRRKLPEDLEERTRTENAAEEEMLKGDRRIRTLVHYPFFSDELAELIGCKPTWRTKLRDPVLAYKLFFGSKIPPVFRLEGPHRQPRLSKHVIKKLPVADTLKGQLTTGLLNIPPVYEAHAAGTVLFEALRDVFRDPRAKAQRDAPPSDRGFHAWGVGQLRARPSSRPRPSSSRRGFSPKSARSYRRRT